MEKMTGIIRRNIKNILRITLFSSLIYYSSAGIFSPLAAAVWKGEKNGPVPPVFDTENGMGGISYLEGSIAGPAEPEIPPEADPALAGIPEPEEFSKPRTLIYSAYRVERGDTIGEIAWTLGLNQDTLISVNAIKSTRLLQIGQILRVPNQDGILHTVKSGDTLASLAEKYQTGVPAIQTANELFSDTVAVNASLFIPGARLERVSLQEINGDLFIWPLSGFISSPYGYRISPFGTIRQFHSGIDIAAGMGTPIRAAMAGRVSTVGYDVSFGNYVVITHHSGYRTLYGHMSVVRVKAGAYVGTGERIGDVGSTGLSTGPHLHFTVYKNGITVNPRNLMK